MASLRLERYRAGLSCLRRRSGRDICATNSDGGDPGSYQSRKSQLSSPPSKLPDNAKLVWDDAFATL